MGGRQKVVMRVPMNDETGRSRALKTVVGVPGCLSVAIEGNDKIVVIGENMDAVLLTQALRKKVGGAELITVALIDDKKKDKKNPEEKKDEKKEEKKDDEKKEEKDDEKKEEKNDEEKKEEKKDEKKPDCKKPPELIPLH